MRIYIADDEYLAISILVSTVNEVLPDAETETFDSGKKLLERVSQRTADIYFLDIEMPEYLGLDLAKKIYEYHSRANIIFVTGYYEYAIDALNVFASGYVTKPVTKDKIKRQIDNLRFPIEKKTIEVKTKPFFHVLCNGEKLDFSRKKTEELLAYLMYKYGKPVDALEIRKALFGRLEGADIKSNSYFHHLKKDLQDAFEKNGETDFLKFENMQYYVDVEKTVDCDYSEIAESLKKTYSWAK